MDLRLNGRVALITGADSGIGWNTAKLLLAEGAKVAVTDLDADELTKAAKGLDAAEDRLVAFPADVTDADSLAELHQQVKEAFGPIDILVQSAGVTGAQEKFHEIDEEGWLSTLDIDLMGPVRVLREFIADLRTGGWGRVVLLASEDGVQPYDDEIPYCAAKAGVLALAKGLSRTYAREGREHHLNRAGLGPVAHLRPGGAARQRCLPGLHPHPDDRRHDDQAVRGTWRQLRRRHRVLPRRGAPLHGAQAPRRARGGGCRHRIPVFRQGLLRQWVELPC